MLQSQWVLYDMGDKNLIYIASKARSGSRSKKTLLYLAWLTEAEWNGKKENWCNAIQNTFPRGFQRGHMAPLSRALGIPLL